MPLDSLNQVIHQLEQQPRWRSRGQFRRVLESWPHIVGAGVSGQAIPLRLDRQILYVAVANPMWAQTLTLERLTLLDKLNRQLHLELRDIRFSSGDWFGRPTPRPTLAPAPQSAPNSTPDWPEWLKQHPSLATTAIPKSAGPPPQTPMESFNQWASLTQQWVIDQPLCPECRCHCPAGELKRWSRCSLCAARSFGRPRANRPY